jgi:hypothetical protein
VPNEAKSIKRAEGIETAAPITASHAISAPWVRLPSTGNALAGA